MPTAIPGMYWCTDVSADRGFEKTFLFKNCAFISRGKEDNVLRNFSRCRTHRGAGLIIIMLATWATAYPKIASPVWTGPVFEQIVTAEQGARDSQTFAEPATIEGGVSRSADPAAMHSDMCCGQHARLVGSKFVDDKTPWTPGDIVSGEDLAKAISSNRVVKPVILQVGIEALFKDAHITDSIFAGPASEAEGLALLKAKAKAIARTKELIIYCGCCPWKNCPNIRPAFVALKQMGFKNVKLLNIPTDFQQDWVSKGFPTVRS